MRFTSILILAAAGLSLSACAANKPEMHSAARAAMPAGTAVEAPNGLASLCKRKPESCVRPAQVEASDGYDDAAFVRLVKTVNRQVNRGVRQMRDRDLFGTPEYWQASGMGKGAAGDCEDLAIEKRLRLIAAGAPAERLFYAVAYRRDIGLHAVLVANTDGGDLVLDSRTPYVRPWYDSPYVWVSRETPRGLLAWATVVDPGPAFASSRRSAGIRAERSGTAALNLE